MEHSYDLERQHRIGKLHAIERIQALLDEDFFREIGSGIKGRNQREYQNGSPEYDGVITGYGTIGGRRVVIYAQDVPGFMPGVGEEEKGIIRYGAKLLYAYAESTVPKITVILRKAYGGAYIAMGSKHLGTDFVYAWPDAEIAVMGEEPAVEILYKKELSNLASERKRARFLELTEEYRKNFMNSMKAVEEGYVDEILCPEETRERIASDLIFLKNKTKNCHVVKKHGNIPL